VTGQDRGERLVESLLFVSVLITVLTTAGIILSLFGETLRFLSHVSVLEFLTGTTWTPLFRPAQFGVLPLVAGTLLITGIAALVALPLGLAAAVYLSEYAPGHVRRVLKPALEVLAGVPTVVYGYFALTAVTPLLRSLFPSIDVFNALSAGIVVGIMIIPMVASVSEDAMGAVPRSLREGAYALGATKFEVTTSVVIPAAFSGVVASFVLAISRAIGETMIVSIAAGSTPKLTVNPLESIQTMTGYIVQVATGDAAYGTVKYQTLYAVGFLLFLMTLGMNILGSWIIRRYREVYR